MRPLTLVLGLVFLSFLAFPQIDCHQSVGPASPAVAPVQSNPNGPLIEAFFVSVNIPAVSVTTSVSVFIMDNTGAPVTNAAVTLTTPNGSFAAAYAATGSSNPPANMGVSNITGGQYAASGVAYTPGQSCSFTVVTGGVTYSSGFTALSASGNVTQGTSGVTCTFSSGGNQDLVQVVGNDNLQYGPSPSIPSPYIIPAANFASDPAGAGHDEVLLYLFQTLEPGFTGAQAKSVIASGYEIGIASY